MEQIFKTAYILKNLIGFYALILLPLGFLFWVNTTQIISANYVLLLIVFYALVYRTYIDGKRLVLKNIIKQGDIWKMVIPGYRFRYFKELYLK